ncbi:hypothetical protein [Microscilla marina]|uniref:Uncharacterized protein n=1 Tax=Microscilla marina ATCC 23134 TaxID=313606 RepID=A1ZIQ7_MICM2|nr:hypothetical protein [Microscilla marina]EAY29925.1 hypothetical protein M23134_05798 [Microscilla marina ATCC 23134]
MIDLYNELEIRLKTPEVGIRHFNLWEGQFDNTSEKFPYPLPAAYLEITREDTSPLGDKVLLVKSSFTLHLGCKDYRPTTTGAKVTTGKGILLLSQVITAQLHGWQSGKFGTLTQVSRRTVNGNGYLYRVEHGYEMSYKDYSPQVEREKIDGDKVVVRIE